MFGRTKWNQTRRLRSHADRRHSKGRKALRQLLRMAALATLGGCVAVLVPRGAAQEPRIVVDWTASLTAGEQPSRRNMSPPLLENRQLFPVWQDAYLRYLDPRDGAIVSEREYADGVAFSTWLHTDPAGSGDILHSDGRFAYRVQNHGRLFFREEQLYSVSRYTHSLRAYTENGETRWEYAPGDLITAVLPVGDGTVVGTAGGSLVHVDADGEVEVIGSGDGDPIVGLEQTAQHLWVFIGGKDLRVEQRSFRHPGKLYNHFQLVVDEPIMRVLSVQANAESVLLPDLGLLLHQDGHREQLPPGSLLFQFNDMSLQLEAHRSGSGDYRDLVVSDRWGGVYLRAPGGSASGILIEENALLLWDDATAALYRLHQGET